MISYKIKHNFRAFQALFAKKAQTPLRGLRNAKLNFRQQEKSHLMENMIFIELLRRGYNVDVGMVEVTVVKDGKKQQSQYEIVKLCKKTLGGEKSKIGAKKI